MYSTISWILAVDLGGGGHPERNGLCSVMKESFQGQKAIFSQVVDERALGIQKADDVLLPRRQPVLVVPGDPAPLSGERPFNGYLPRSRTGS